MRRWNRFAQQRRAKVFLPILYSVPHSGSRRRMGYLPRLSTSQAGSLCASRPCYAQDDKVGRSGLMKSSDKSGAMRLRIERAIRAIPRGKVSTYGGVARAAGVPGAARQVAAVLRRGFGLPWQRVLGAGGAIKLTADSAVEQRLRLEAEGVRFRGRRVDMKAFEWKFRKSEAGESVQRPRMIRIAHHCATNSCRKSRTSLGTISSAPLPQRGSLVRCRRRCLRRNPRRAG